MRDLKLTPDSTGRIDFFLDNPPQTVIGLSLLKQRVFIELLSNQEPGFGASLPQILADGYSASFDGIQLAVQESIRLAADHIRLNTPSAAPKTEQLKSLSILDITNTDGQLFIELQLESEAGQTDVVTLNQ